MQCEYMRKFFASTPTYLAMPTQINNAKATKKCIPSGRNDDVLVVKNVIFRISAKRYILGKTLSGNLGSLGINVEYYSYNIQVYTHIIYTCM